MITNTYNTSYSTQKGTEHLYKIEMLVASLSTNSQSLYSRHSLHIQMAGVGLVARYIWKESHNSQYTFCSHRFDSREV